MQRLLDVVRHVARSDVSVLITGESGTGKEIIARALHHYSARADQAWIDVSCGALPEHLMESELFGYEKGAFSGADRSKPGLFELADGGTLLLDEIGELEPRMQAKLLRVLDGFSYFRLGGVSKVSVNVRIVAATNRDLSPTTEDNGFREDLYHRLSQAHLEVPPLRKRRRDVTPLAEFFLTRQDPRLRLTAEARERLETYRFPGNVRELRNVVSRAALTCANFVVSAGDLPPRIQAASPPTPEPAGGARESSSPSAELRLDEVERRAILQVMDTTGGQKQRAAHLLGISLRTLNRKLRSYSSPVADEQVAKEDKR
ncbi:MAG: sigma-54-dependent Fis family transcriptional regulator [bacterium]|nr:sigma-54-dependent Fis family transcriptional regulator [bacterium]